MKIKVDVAAAVRRSLELRCRVCPFWEIDLAFWRAKEARSRALWRKENQSEKIE